MSNQQFKTPSKEVLAILRKMRVVCKHFLSGKSDLAEYKKELFLLAERLDPSITDPQTQAAVHLIDATRHVAEREPDIEKVRQNARAFVQLVSIYDE